VHHTELRAVRTIERFTKQDIAVEVIAGHEPKRSASRSPKPAAKINKAAPGERRAGKQDWYDKSNGARRTKNARPRTGYASGAPRTSGNR
jgi:hypothetical protein